MSLSDKGNTVQERRLKELFDIIPSFDDLYALRSEGLRADVILVDDKDKKLSMLKQLTVTLVKGLSSNPAAVIKKIAGLVCFCSYTLNFLLSFSLFCISVLVK